MILSSALASYKADVVSATYYYPFGSAMQTWGNDSSYKYAFNGKEKDSEGLGGGGSTYDYGFRIYNANLGRFLSVDPLTKSYPTFSPYHFAANSPLKFIDLDGLEVYITGTVADNLVNLLEANTGLVLSRDPVSGLLSYATKTIVNPFDGTEICVPILKNENNSQVSTTLREILIKAINGGQGIDPVKIIAMKRIEIKAINLKGEDNVFFDVPPAAIADAGVNPALFNTVDFSDFIALGGETTLQNAVLAHVIEERLNASKGWNTAHNAGNLAEQKVIQEKDPVATIRNDASSRRNLSSNYPAIFKEKRPGYIFDYGSTEFTTEMKGQNHGIMSSYNPSEVVGVKQTKPKIIK